MNTPLPPPPWDVAVRHMIRLGAAAVIMGVHRLPEDHRSGEAARVALRALHDVNCATFSDRSFEEVGTALIVGLGPLAELGFEPVALFARAVGVGEAPPEAEAEIWETLRRRMDDVDGWFLSGLRDLAKWGLAASLHRGATNYAPRVLQERSKLAASVPIEELEGAMQRLLDVGRIRVEIEGPAARRRSRLVVTDPPADEE